MENRVAAKLMRLEMSDQLGKLLRGMPVILQETTKTDCVYLGMGTVEGLQQLEVVVKVFLDEEKHLMASVEVESSEVLSAPFKTEEEQTSFPSMATKAILSRMN